MKKVLAMLLALLMLFTLAACSGETSPTTETNTPEVTDAATATLPAEATPEVTDAEPVELVVFAAASMTETLTEIAELYKEVAPNVTITPTYDSSGTLKTQIQEGADCDIFISASQKSMNELDMASDKNTEGLDFVLSDTRFNLVENKVVLVVPEGNPAGVASFDDIATDTVSMIALGNSDVPVGQYSEEIFTSMGIWDQIQSKITFGSNVKEVTTWVDEKTVDCGVVYATDAYSAGLEIAADCPEGMIKTPIVYPAAVLKQCANVEAAQAFLDFLKTDACTAVFENVGFTIPA